MHKRLSMLLTISLLTVAQGCGDSSSTPAGQAPSPTVGVASDESISQVAKIFLEAVRSGNSTVAASQLTPLAQQRMREADMDFEILANDAATYQIGQVEKLEADEAIVETVWTEPDAEGQAQQEQWTLALQNIEGQWRILGIVAETGPNQPPVVMDFENPGQPVVPPANTAGTTPSPNTVPQQATRPTAQDPFRQ